MTAPPSAPPAKPRRPKSRLIDSPSLLHLKVYSPRLFTGCFMILWLTGWTIACIALAFHTHHEPTLFNFLFALPFWASGIFVFFALIYQFTLREELLLSPEYLLYSRRALIPLLARAIPLHELQNASLHIEPGDDGPPTYSLQFQTTGNPLRALSSLPQDELLWLAHLFSSRIADFQAATPPSPQAPALPTDSRWSLQHSPAEIAFSRQGRFAPTACFGLLFVNIFWNSIVSVFLSIALGIGPIVPPLLMRLGLATFLLPFIAVGLILFTTLLANLLEPFHTTRWIFTSDALHLNHTLLGFSRHNAWPTADLARLDIHHAPRPPHQLSFNYRDWLAPADAAEAPYRLRFLSSTNEERLHLRHLTQGEATTLAQTLHQTFPSTYPAITTSETPPKPS